MKPIKLIFILLILLKIEFSFGQDGSFDNSFGNNGVKLFSLGNFNTRGNEILYLSNGSILISGYSYENLYGSWINQSLFVAKFLLNGDLDINFGTNGIIFIPNGANGSSLIQSMVQQPDGNILFIGVINGNLVLFRINQNGIFDSIFGNNGIVSINSGSKIGLQSNGKIVLSGQYYDGYNNLYNFSRYNCDGTIDSTFGNNGIIQTDVTSFRFDLCQSIKIQNDNKIIAVGTSYEDATQRNAVIVRFNENGTLDNLFGNNGIIIEIIGSSPGYGVFNDVDILQDGKIIACGNMEYSGGTGGFGGTMPAIVKYNSDGTLDTTFGNIGKVILNTVYNANDNIRTIATQLDNKIIIGGNAGNPFPNIQSSFYLTRLNSDGSLDLTFGNNGKILSNFSNSETNIANDIVIQENGKILTVGLTKDSSNQFFNTVVCRFINDSTLNIDNIEIENEIAIYPNPTNDKITIILPDKALIEFLNINGQIFKTINYYSGETSVDIGDLSSGVYIIKAKTDKGIVTKKFIKD